MLSNVKAVLFDLDGTLIDSMWVWGDIDIIYLKKHGIAYPEDLLYEIEGMSFKEVAVYFKERFFLPDSLDEIQDEWTEMAKEKYKNEVPLKPGVYPFLEYLKLHGIHTGIATSNNRELLTAVMNAHHLQDYIEYTMTSCEAGAGKPAPDIYLKVSEAFHVKPEECLVFEDTPSGIMAGKNAGITVCAMEDTYTLDRKELIQELADYYITDFTQVLDGTYKKLK